MSSQTPKCVADLLSKQSFNSPDGWNDSLLGLRPVDQALRCPLCSCFFENPVLLDPCGHSVCSLCRSDFEIQVCPTCQRPIDRYIPNVSLRECLNHFKEFRRSILGDISLNSVRVSPVKESSSVQCNRIPPFYDVGLGIKAIQPRYETYFGKVTKEKVSKDIMLKRIRSYINYWNAEVDGNRVPTDSSCAKKVLAEERGKKILKSTDNVAKTASSDNESFVQLRDRIMRRFSDEQLERLAFIRDSIHNGESSSKSSLKRSRTLSAEDALAPTQDSVSFASVAKDALPTSNVNMNTSIESDNVSLSNSQQSATLARTRRALAPPPPPPKRPTSVVAQSSSGLPSPAPAPVLVSTRLASSPPPLGNNTPAQNIVASSSGPSTGNIPSLSSVESSSSSSLPPDVLIDRNEFIRCTGDCCKNIMALWSSKKQRVFYYNSSTGEGKWNYRCPSVK